jgi:hypothetical protein
VSHSLSPAWNRGSRLRGGGSRRPGESPRALETRRPAPATGPAADAARCRGGRGRGVEVELGQTSDTQGQKGRPQRQGLLRQPGARLTLTLTLSQLRVRHPDFACSNPHRPVRPIPIRPHAAPATDTLLLDARRASESSQHALSLPSPTRALPCGGYLI